MVSDGPYKGGSPYGREAAEVMNELYRFWRGRQRVEGLTWLLGDREFFALHAVEPDSTGVAIDPNTGRVLLFGIPVLRVVGVSQCRLVADVARKEVL